MPAVADPRLTEVEIEDFHSRGWVVREALFRRDEVARIRHSFEQLEVLAESLHETGLCQGSHFVLGELAGEKIIKRVVWAGGSEPYLLQIGEDPRLTVPAAQLLGNATMHQLLSQAHFKRPGDTAKPSAPCGRSYALISCC